MRLSDATAGTLPSGIDRFGFDRGAQAFGIVHFGIGAFHRAHQAWYTDLAMSGGDRDWAICGVTLRSDTVRRQLEPQQGLYTVTQRSATAQRTRLVGAVREVLFAQDQAEQVVDRIAAKECRIVSFTVTEKGYARASGGGLDFGLAEKSFYPVLGTALARRAELGMRGVTLLSCDNLSGNGGLLWMLVREWLAGRHPDALGWFDRCCMAPDTMVDRIVPGSSEADLEALGQRLGLSDEGAVFTEPFSQWVIEDRFACGRPRWEAVGVQMVEDVAPYEQAKLRMLNGAHSLLAYCGLAAGHAYVHEAIADPGLRVLVERLMLQEAAPTLAPAPAQDLEAYAAQLLARFAEPALQHRLAQIAADGSQKIPERWLDTAEWHHRRGGETGAIRKGFRAWYRHLRQNDAVDDPLKPFLTEAARDNPYGEFLALCLGCETRTGIWPGRSHLAALLR